MELPAIPGSLSLGVEQIEKVILFSLSIGNAAGRAFEDGEIGIGDLGALFQLLGAVKDIVGVDFSRVWPEAKDVDQQEFNGLIDLVVDKFDIPQQALEDKMEVLVEKSKVAYAAVAALVVLFQELLKAKRALEG